MLIYLPLEANAVSAHPCVIISTFIVQFLANLIRDSPLANRACVFALKPLRYAFIVESMQTWQNDVFLLH